MIDRQELFNKIAKLPSDPGIYQFRDEILTAFKALTNDPHGTPSIIQNSQGVITGIQSILDNRQSLFFLQVGQCTNQVFSQNSFTPSFRLVFICALPPPLLHQKCDKFPDSLTLEAAVLSIWRYIEQYTMGDKRLISDTLRYKSYYHVASK